MYVCNVISRRGSQNNCAASVNKLPHRPTNNFVSHVIQSRSDLDNL